MRKGLKLILAGLVVVAFAAPAMAATVDMTGFYRAKAYMSNYYDSKTGNIIPTKLSGAETYSYVDQRWRGKIAVGEENVKAVVFLEYNQKWGDGALDNAAYKSGTPGQGLPEQGSSGTGGNLGTDGVNQLRAKNVYLWFKIPDTSVDFTVGLQNVTDSYAGVFFGAADMAGVFSNAKPAENLALRFGAANLIQNTGLNKDNSALATASGVEQKNSNNVAMFVAEAKFMPSKDVKVGANLYFLRDGGVSWKRGVGSSTATALAAGTTKLYMPGVDFAANLGVANLSGFLFAQFGDRTYDAAGSEKTKFGGYAADVRADLAAGPAKIFVEGLYTTGDKSTSANKYEGIVTLDDYRFGSGSSTYARHNMEILAPSPDSIGSSRALAYDMNNGGAGVTFLTAGAAMNVTPKITVKGNLGYMTANQLTGDQKIAGNGKSMGTEVNATVSYNVMKGLDAGLTGAYVFAGNYYKATGAESPTDPYALTAKINYAY